MLFVIQFQVSGGRDGEAHAGSFYAFRPRIRRLVSVCRRILASLFRVMYAHALYKISNLLRFSRPSSSSTMSRMTRPAAQSDPTHILLRSNPSATPSSPLSSISKHQTQKGLFIPSGNQSRRASKSKSTSMPITTYPPPGPNLQPFILDNRKRLLLIFVGMVMITIVVGVPIIISKIEGPG